ncbi:MAG TPA: AraC family transcriptional regulator [Terriglobales bacterium]|nr:AraC family transcriptional regulator [Terriglobales bacterium]
MAKIAIDVERALAQRECTGAPGSATGRVLAKGLGWTVEDVVCNSGPHDRPFEELHSNISIAMVAVGSFQYRSDSGRALMTPGSLLLGNAGHCFQCGHEHAAGDRCIAFRFEPDYFARLVRDGVGIRFQRFNIPRLPPMRELSPLFAHTIAILMGDVDFDWEEISLNLAAVAVRLANGEGSEFPPAVPSSEARITRALRRIESSLNEKLTLQDLAREARLSPYHFLRTFELIAGLTPHQYIRRARLRDAAARIIAEPSRILDIALDSGFGDVSNFNRAFRAEFGASPRGYRAGATQ